MVHITLTDAAGVHDFDSKVNEQEIDFAAILRNQSTPLTQNLATAKQAISRAVEELQALTCQSTSLDALKTAKRHLSTAGEAASVNAAEYGG